MFIPVPKGYYETEHWKKTAAKARAYYRYTCQRCGEKGGWLEVHHLHYKTLWHESMSDLRPLCHKCHTKGKITAWRIDEDLKAEWYLQKARLLLSFFFWLIALPFRWAVSALQRRGRR